MQRIMMKSKIHRARVTDANLDYEGSITIDRDLIEAANLLPHERVQVVDIDNGARFETYVIEGQRGSGVVCLNGAAARLVQPGDKVIVISYASFDEAELVGYEPIVVHVDADNRLHLQGATQGAASAGPEEQGAASAGPEEQGAASAGPKKQVPA